LFLSYHFDKFSFYIILLLAEELYHI